MMRLTPISLIKGKIEQVSQRQNNQAVELMRKTKNFIGI
jgi:hypothetical protein